MNAYLDTPVGQLVAAHPGRSQVFERWGLDYCCGGKLPLAQACARKKVDAEAVARDLEALDLAVPAPPVAADADLAEICDRAEQVHHRYLREALPRLSYLTARVATRHGEREPRLIELNQRFEDYRSVVQSQIAAEESKLFPLLRAGTAVDGAEWKESLDHRHDEAAIEEMASLANRFEAQEGDCNTHRAMLFALREFAADMEAHARLERDLLLPRLLPPVS